MSAGAAWTDRDGRPLTVPEPPPSGSHYAEVGDFQGAHYDRNAFVGGTAQEAAFLWEALRLEPGAVVVDAGCGTGRHCDALAARGATCVGVDVSSGLLAVAAGRGGRYVRADARRLPVRAGAADAALSVCQGGFGITPGGDRRILAELARVLRPGGRLVVTAFSLAFAVRWAAREDGLDLTRGLVWTLAEVRGPDGARRRFDLWTTCYTPPQLAALLAAAGLRVEGLYGAEPGAYGTASPTLAHPELLAVATR